MEKKIAVVQFPGSNCEDETLFALKRAGVPCEPFLWNGLLSQLSSFAGYVIVGGFSYEDRSRAGVIAALEPVMVAIAEQAQLGKPVLGICNGAQILVETGLIPGYASRRLGVVLAPNRMEVDGKLAGVGYYNDYCFLKTGIARGNNAYNRLIDPNETIRIPFAHAEGRFIFEPGLETILETKAMIAFRYVDETGTPDADFPVNPNGSQANAAAVTNVTGNVMAIMPHPERVPEGDRIFASMGEYASSFDQVRYEPESVEEPPSASKRNITQGFEYEPDVQYLPVKLVITDNTALSVEDALHHKGFNVTVERWVLWTVRAEGKISPSQKQRMIDSGELLNTNKEWIDDLESVLECSKMERVFLVNASANPTGLMKLQTLRSRFGMQDLKRIDVMQLWKIRTDDPSVDWDAVIDTHLFHNPVSDQIFVLNHSLPVA
jgi:phosphoribosylformylglycinamidine synthase subunit PurQ / glutaminase